MSYLKSTVSAAVSTVEVFSSTYASHIETTPLFCGGHAQYPDDWWAEELGSSGQLWALNETDTRRKAALASKRSRSIFHRSTGVKYERVYSVEQRERFERHQMVQARFKRSFRASVAAADPYIDILDEASYHLSRASSLASSRNSLRSSGGSSARS